MSGTSATATFNIVNDHSAGVYLSGSETGVDQSTAANNFAPGVSVVVKGVAPISGGPTSGDFFFRNTNAGATLGQVTLNNFTPGNLAIQFDNASITIDPSQSILAGFAVGAGSSSNLTIAAGGNVTETAAGIATSGAATFAGLGGSSTIIAQQHEQRPDQRPLPSTLPPRTVAACRSSTAPASRWAAAAWAKGRSP